jgi:hypothetical protein
MQDQCEKPLVNVVFSTNVHNMDDWSRRTGIPLTTADALGTTYARAHRWLLALSSQLVSHHGWKHASSADPRMLVSIDTQSVWRSTGGLPLSPPLNLRLPLYASSFFSPERRVQWEMVFHSHLFSTYRMICPPITDILNILQCLLTGLVTLVHEENLPEGLHRTVRALPPLSWVNEHEDALVDIFGHSHFKQLRAACTHTASSHKLQVLPFQPYYQR